MQRCAALRLLAALTSRPACAEGAGGVAAVAPSHAAPRCAAPYYPTAAAAAAAAASVKLCSFSSAAATAKSTANVPLGHHDSDLSSVACHIGLGRRRDLTMREDLGLWKSGDARVSLGDVFRVGARARVRGGRASGTRASDCPWPCVFLTRRPFAHPCVHTLFASD
jgi:hypothetical protein